MKELPQSKPTALELFDCTKHSHRTPLLPCGQGRKAESHSEPPPFSSPRLLERCLCCSFCRLFREAVLSRGTSDFMSICKGTHLCLLPAKGQDLSVTQVQRAGASIPQSLPSKYPTQCEGSSRAFWSKPFLEPCCHQNSVRDITRMLKSSN